MTALKGKKHRPGVYQCNGCREQFTVTVKTVFERSKIPLSKWSAALFLLTASKKGVSAHQMHRRPRPDRRDWRNRTRQDRMRS